MKKRTKSDGPDLPEEDAGAPEDRGLPEEPRLLPAEAAEAVGGARRLLEQGERGTATEPAPAVPLIPWPPLRPDEKPS